jgi:hypothetical protein
MTKTLLLCVLLIAFLSSCATLIEGKYQRVQISTIPEGATVTVQGTGEKITTPGTLLLERRKKGSKIVVSLAGYEGVGEDSPYVIETGIDNIIWLNLLTQGLGFLVDWGTGAMWEYEAHHIINLNRR